MLSRNNRTTSFGSVGSWEVVPVRGWAGKLLLAVDPFVAGESLVAVCGFDPQPETSAAVAASGIQNSFFMVLDSVQ
jgi:hypothetical protein